MRTPRRRRIDSTALVVLLAVAGAALAIVGVVLPLLGVVGLIDPVVTSRGISLDDAWSDAAPGEPIAITSTGTARLSFADPDFAQRALLALPRIVGAAFSLTVVYLLLCIARTLKSGNPFIPANTRRLTAIAVVIIMFGLLGPALDAATISALAHDAAVDDLVSFEMEFAWTTFVLGLLIAALAEVFRRGTRRSTETERLV